MQCKKGIYIKSQDQVVPCGQCMPCRINKGRLWSGRIILENLAHYEKTYFNGLFCTLTYNDDTVPCTVEGVQSLRKKTFRKWLSNQAKIQGSFRYYAVGEYGDLTKRPHYHLALFCFDNEQANAILETWRKSFGFVQVAEITDERARYLANYTAKKLTKHDDDRLEYGQEPEFRISSRNPPIGAAYIDKLVENFSSKHGKRILKERGDIERSFRFNGRIYPVHPWILTKARERLGIPVLHRDRCIHPEYLKWHEIMEAEINHEEADQIERNLHAKKKQRLHRSTTVNL